ncbi:hypothetical protein FB451DRAFT_1562400 [Mycena latifolia]|nr:hypothetical protein FB451DRAFT_1562400 [Mycena latifolia]
MISCQVSQLPRGMASDGHIMRTAVKIKMDTSTSAFRCSVGKCVRAHRSVDEFRPAITLEWITSSPIGSSLHSYSFLCSPHPIFINPFKSALSATFIQEHGDAFAAARYSRAAPNDRPVWILCRILKGEGDDLCPYSPSALAGSELPPSSKATQLMFDDALYRHESHLDGIPDWYASTRNTTASLRTPWAFCSPSARRPHPRPLTCRAAPIGAHIPARAASEPALLAPTDLKLARLPRACLLTRLPPTPPTFDLLGLLRDPDPDC